MSQLAVLFTRTDELTEAARERSLDVLGYTSDNLVIVAAIDTGVTEGISRKYRDPFPEGKGKPMLVCQEECGVVFGHEGCRFCTVVCGVGGEPLEADSVHVDPEVQAVFLIPNKKPVVEIHMYAGNENKPKLTRISFVARDGVLWHTVEPVGADYPDFFQDARGKATAKVTDAVLDFRQYYKL